MLELRDNHILQFVKLTLAIQVKVRIICMLQFRTRCMTVNVD